MNEANGEKVALVTGASKGIGQAICVELAKSGYRIVVNYLSDEKGGLDTLAMVRKAGSTVKSCNLMFQISIKLKVPWMTF